MDRATMSLQYWVIVLVGLMSYFNPERALGARRRKVSVSFRWHGVIDALEGGGGDETLYE